MEKKDGTGDIVFFNRGVGLVWMALLAFSGPERG